MSFQAKVLTVSTSVAAGRAEDRGGEVVASTLEAAEIHVIERRVVADGTDQVRVTNNSSPDGSARWVTNSRILYQHKANGHFDTLAMNVDGTLKVNVTPEAANDAARLLHRRWKKINWRCPANWTRRELRTCLSIVSPD